jgi:hypothetical protein
MAQYQAQIDQQATSGMSDAERLQYENARLRQEYERLAAGAQQLQAVQQAQLYQRQLVDYYAQKGVPNEVIQQNLQSPQQLQEAAIEYFRNYPGQQAPVQQQAPRQPVQQAPTQPAPPWSPQQPLVTSHTQASQSPEISGRLDNLAEVTRKNPRKDTVFEALEELEKFGQQQ